VRKSNLQPASDEEQVEAIQGNVDCPWRRCLVRCLCPPLLIPSNGNEHATFENFEKIKEGMTLEQVTAILGQATHIDRDEHSTFTELLSAIFGAPAEAHRYVGKRDADCDRPVIVIGFSRTQKVVRVGFRMEYDPTLAQKLLDRIKQASRR
jgi:hypothetical protein